MNQSPMKILTIEERSPYLSSVKSLWRANSATLGFFPDGAFNEHANKQNILIAIDSDGTFAGYLLFRISRMRGTIVHLCIEPAYRNKGVAKLLVNHLHSQTKKHEGIGLLCRRDFPANELWRHLGFHATSEKQGRSSNGELLTFWWLDHGHPTLFTLSNQLAVQSKIKAVIDANVFYDLQDEPNPENEESKSLLADWLQDSLSLCITDEIFNEIHRHDCANERRRRRSFVEKFTKLHSNHEKVEEVKGCIRKMFPSKLTDSDKSDLQQLAKAISADAQFFVTQDKALLDLEDEVYKEFKLTIIRPCNLIIRLDELIREIEYHPNRLAGSNIQIKLATADQEPLIIKVFQNFSQRESKSDLQHQLHSYLANPRKFEVWLVVASDQLSALIVYDKQTPKTLTIPLFRITQNSISITLARYLVCKTILDSLRLNRLSVNIMDKYLSDALVNALLENSFLNHDGKWKKFNLSVNESAGELANRLEVLSTEYPKDTAILNSLSKRIIDANSSKDFAALLQIENSLRPAKIIDIEIPTFIIPIKSFWAAELFDEKLSNQTLFASRPELILSSENVYYRAKRPSILSAPARVLWYVSQAKGYSGTMHVRAYSRISEVLIGKPKALFSKFRRLGVYQWKNILELANNNVETEIMAVKFDSTELFDNPLHLDDLKRIIYETESRNLCLQSPVRISNESFIKIYRQGFKTNLEDIN